jgi:hypothetical protein
MTCGTGSEALTQPLGLRTGQGFSPSASADCAITNSGRDTLRLLAMDFTVGGRGPH